MKRGFLALGLALCGPSIGVAEAPPGIPEFSKVQSDYVLACGGCHGENGISNSRLVPDLAGQVGHFLAIPEGREYLVQLPNVANAALEDEALANVLNFMVWTIGGASAAPAGRRFTPGEVGALRQHPLNDVSLRQLRQRLVDTLVSAHGAPESLRYYSAVAR